MRIFTFVLKRITMTKKIVKTFILAILMSFCSCNQSTSKKQFENSHQEVLPSQETPTIAATITIEKEPTDFIPEGFRLFEKVIGDLNNDGAEDCILIIKDTDKDNVINDENRGTLDRNRRGILVLFKTNNKYQLVSKNYRCFSSENEDGGVYFAPDLTVEIDKGKLFVRYGHGRYGYWSYTFRYKNTDFELIGYDQSNGGVIISSETSINFLTRNKITNRNTNDNAEGGDEVFETTTTKVKSNSLLKLSEIEDFDTLDFSED